MPKNKKTKIPFDKKPKVKNTFPSQRNVRFDPKDKKKFNINFKKTNSVTSQKKRHMTNNKKNYTKNRYKKNNKINKKGFKFCPKKKRYFSEKARRRYRRKVLYYKKKYFYNKLIFRTSDLRLKDWIRGKIYFKNSRPNQLQLVKKKPLTDKYLFLYFKQKRIFLNMLTKLKRKSAFSHPLSETFFFRQYFKKNSVTYKSLNTYYKHITLRLMKLVFLTKTSGYQKSIEKCNSYHQKKQFVLTSLRHFCKRKYTR